jgi:hypothetical protein
MKGLLNNVLEITSKYVELPEYKRYSCLTIDKLVPEYKL